jgi:Thrombospondin type 3 repeat
MAMRRQLLASIILTLSAVTSQAALHGRLPATPGGTDYRAYYDDVLKITWLADANYARTSGYDADGQMTWSSAQHFLFILRAIEYLGASDWRLPRVTDTGTPGCNFAYSGTDCGYNVDLTTGEMVHLYYSTLGNKSYYDTNGDPTGCSNTPPKCRTNDGPFSNIQAFYWSGSAYAPDVNRAWGSDFWLGNQASYFVGDEVLHAWPVLDGDIELLVDSDGDGFPDGIDNCTLVANPTQLDTDGDGYGNACDADLNNDGNVNFSDLALFRAAFGTVNANADLNGSAGVVNFTDLAIFRALFGKAPGPSGVGPTTTISSPPAEGSSTFSMDANFTLTSSVPATICWSLDAGPLSCSASPAKIFVASLSGLMAGNHQLTAIATDAAHNSASTVRHWTVEP